MTDTAEGTKRKTRGEVEDAARDVPVAIAWSRVMSDLTWLGKDQWNGTGGGFAFRGIDDVMNALGPILRRHGVFIVPAAVASVEYGEIATGRNRTPMGHVLIRQAFRIYGPQGDSIELETIGEAMDSGDKAGPKASSVALRTALLQALCLPTGEPDPDSDTYERSEAGREQPRSDPGLDYADSVRKVKDRIWEALPILGIPEDQWVGWIDAELQRLSGTTIKKADLAALEALYGDMQGRIEVAQTRGETPNE